MHSPRGALVASFALVATTAFASARPTTAHPRSSRTVADGLTFTYRVQSSASAARDRSAPAEKTGPSPNMLATVRMSGGNVRMDFREGGMPTTDGGGYVIVRGAEQQLVLVNAKDRQAMIIAADGLGSGLGALTNNALIKMTVRDPRFAFEELGPGERILGYATRRVRIRSGSSIEVRVLGRTRRSSDSSVSEQWIASRPAGIDPEALQGWSKSFGMGMQRTNPEMAQMMDAYRRKYGDGLALRTVSVGTRVDDKGQARTDTVRMEVTELSRAAIDPAIFSIPAGYQTVDMRQMASSIDSARHANGDTGSIGDALKKGTADAAKQGTVEAAKNALGGLFGRRRP